MPLLQIPGNAVELTSTVEAEPMDFDQEVSRGRGSEVHDLLAVVIAHGIPKLSRAVDIEIEIGIERVGQIVACRVRVPR